MNLPLANAYRAAMFDALAIQSVCTILSVLMLDGGNAATLCFAILVGFWVGVVMLVLRRPVGPRPADLAVIRFGFLPLFIIGFIVMEAILS